MRNPSRLGPHACKRMRLGDGTLGVEPPREHSFLAARRAAPHRRLRSLQKLYGRLCVVGSELGWVRVGLGHAGIDDAENQTRVVLLLLCAAAGEENR